MQRKKEFHLVARQVNIVTIERRISVCVCVSVRVQRETLYFVLFSWDVFWELTSLISPTSRFLVSEPEPFASGGGPELVGVHGAEMVSAAATALPVTIKHVHHATWLLILCLYKNIKRKKKKKINKRKKEKKKTTLTIHR